MIPRLGRLRVAPTFVFRTAAVLAAVLLTNTAASAQFIWSQPATGTAENWSVGPWTPGVPPANAPATILDFNVLAGRGNYTFTNNIPSFIVSGVNLNSWSTNTLTLSLTNQLRFDRVNGGGPFGRPFIGNNGPGNVTISGTGGILLDPGSNDGLVINGGGNGTLTISSIISGEGPVTINMTGLGIVRLDAANTFLGGAPVLPGVPGVTLTNGTLSLGNATALGAAANVLTINGAGGSLQVGNVTIANNITATQSLVVAGGSTMGTLSGIISGAGGLQLRNFNAANAGLTLTAANTFTGATTLQSFIPNARQDGPTLTLGGANGAIASVNTVTVGKNATLNIGVAGVTNGNRIANAAPIVVNNGTINFVPNVAATNETLGNLTINGSMRIGTTPTGVSTLQFGTLTRNNGGVLWLTSNNFGNVAVPATNTRVFFTGATAAGLNFVAGTIGVDTQIGIVPWAVGGGATAPTGFTNYDDVDGLRVIPITDGLFVTQVATPAAFTTGITGGTLTNRNINLSGAGAYVMGGSSLTVNAFSTSAGGTVGLTGGTLTVASGTVLNTANTTFGTGMTLDFGAQRGFIHSSASTVFLDGSQITGSGGLVITGAGVGSGATIANTTTFQNNGGNPFTGGLIISGNVQVGFRQDNQLGDAAGTITFDGGLLAYNAAANLTINRNITLGLGNGGFTFNQTGSGATAGNADANTVLELSGIISGAGAFTKEGIGAVNLSGANTYTGGTVITGGTLQFTDDADLGAAGTRIVLNGGTLQPLAAGPFARPVELNASSTILTNVNATLSSPFSTIGQLYGTAIPTLTKSGTGTLSLTAASPNLSGNVTVSAGTLSISGANGALPQVSTFTVNSGATLAINNAANNANRINDFAQIIVNGGTFNYITGAAVTGNPAERMGVLTLTSTGRVNIDATTAGSSTILRFASLTPIPAGDTVIFSGTSLGGTTGNFTRILFDTAPAMTLSGIILGANFSNVSNGASQGLAGYNATNGIVLVPTPAVSGALIDNFAPTNTPISAIFTTNAPATANTGAVVHQLILDGGDVNLVNGPLANVPSATNNFTPTGTLGIGNSIISQNGAKAITVTAGTTSPTIAFGLAVADITTTSDLSIANGIALTGTAGAAKSGAGVLTLNGAYNVTGPLAANAGTLTFGAASTVLSTPAITTSNGGTVLNFNGTAGASIGVLTLGAGTTANLGQNVSAAGLAGTGALNLAPGNLTLTPATAQTFNGVIAGAGSLLYSPSAIALLTLGGNNAAFAGGITGNANARLAATNANALGTGTINVSAQTASSTTAIPTVGFNFGASSSTTLTNNFVLSQSTGGLDLFFTAFGSTNQTVNLTGLISSAGALTNTLVWDAATADQSNVLILGNSGNTFVANVRVGSGTIAIASDGALGAAANQVTLANTALPPEGSLRFDANAISVNRQVNVTGNGASINTNGFNATISGVFAGTSTFSKIGAGTLTLGNAGNTFNGIVNVNGGTLLVNGNLAGNAGVATNVTGGGSILAGTGSLGTAPAQRSVNVSGGGTLAGGDPAANVGIDPGTLTVRGNVTVNAGSNFQVRLTTALSSGTLGGSSGGAGDPLNNSFLVLSETGTLFTLNGTIVIDGTGLTFNPTQPYSYTVAQLPAGHAPINITDQSRFSTIGFGDTPENMALVTNAGFVYLNFTPVPEPATVLGLAAGALGLGGYVRRRFRRV